MVDYYEELSLARDLDSKHIQDELVRLESLWRRREVTNPEKAAKMIALVIDAKTVFVSEYSRRKYDNELDASRKEPEDPDVSRSKALEKWTNQARDFFDDEQYDLAKAAIDNALGYVGNTSTNEDLFHLAARIYLKNNEVKSSMEYVNKAIICSPEWYFYYITKAQIFEERAWSEQQYDKRQANFDECRKNLTIALSKAQASGDEDAEGVALGALAFSLYYHPNPDVALAEKYANRAEALGERANSPKILDSIAEKRNTPVYNEAKKEESYGNLQHLRKALELYESLGDWRDAAERAAECRARIGKIEADEATRRKERERREEAEIKERERQRKAAEEERRRQAEEREREAQAKLEAQKRRKEWAIKIAKVASPIVAAVIVIIVLINSVFIPSKKYHDALDLMKSGRYDEAIAAFQVLDGFRNSEGKIVECYDAISQQEYDVAVGLMNEGKYQEAISAFEKIGHFSDSITQIEVCKQQGYQAAITLMDDGKLEESLAIFSSLDNYERSEGYVFDIKLLQSAPLHDTISAGLYHSVALRNDGTVISTNSPKDGRNYGQCDVNDWTDIIAISAGAYHTVGLKADGTVVATGMDLDGQCSVSDWVNIVAISAGGYHTVGLRADGTVVAVGENDDGQCSVSRWRDIIAIAGGTRNTYGLKADGTVVAVGSSYSGVLGAENWTNITKIKAGVSSVAGLKSDGSVLVLGSNLKQENVNGWTDIIALDVDIANLVALCSDGTVLRDGESSMGSDYLIKRPSWNNISSWRDIVSVSAGGGRCIGLKSDGTVVGAGESGYGLDVNNWSDICIPSN